MKKNLLIFLCANLLFVGLNRADNKSYQIKADKRISAKNDIGQEVISHYVALGDSEKINAAKFLVKNMKYHYSYESPILNEYYLKVKKVGKEYNYPKSITHYQCIYHEMGNLDVGKEKVYDKDIITAKTLISNIEMAFTNWRKGKWAQHLSFEEFCEYLLPYRVGNEHYEEWRNELRNLFYKYAIKENGCDERRYSAFWAAYRICDGIKKFGFHVEKSLIFKVFE